MAAFVADLAPEVRPKILGLFQSELAKIFSNPEVCKWLAEHLKLMHAESLHLARFLCSKKGVRAYDILQLSRVCEVPPKAENLLTVAKHFLMSDKQRWVHECLLELPS